MGWVVKGYKDSGVIYSETAQYVADVLRCIKEAITAGSAELYVVKKGSREYLVAQRTERETKED